MMAKKSKKNQQRLTPGKTKPRLLSSASCSKISKNKSKKEAMKSSAPEKNDWKDAVCPVCIECPHQAVLLLCASHMKGCRPYICDTSYEFSNCLDRYKEASPKNTELSCPLCRGKVTGWTAVKPAREFLNSRRRTCSQDDCSFSGKFEDLKAHTKLIHPLAKPKEVDPELEEEWKIMEEERERNDLMSSIRATTPGAMVVGDYVIENPTPIAGHSNLSESIRNMMNFILTVPSLTDPGSTSLSSRLLRRELHRNLRQSGTVNGDSGLDDSLSPERARPLARLNRISLSRSARRRRHRTQE